MDNQHAGKKGFCTFCMGRFEPNRIGSHVRQCIDRRDDADCVQLNGRPHPMAFLLMARTGDRMDGWVCLEAHAQADFSLLDQAVRQLWFPEIDIPGCFRPGRRMLRRGGAAAQIGQDLQLDSVLEVKDQFTWALPESTTGADVSFDVLGFLPTAIMNCRIDLAAFPPGCEGDRWRPIGNPNRALTRA